MKHPGQLRKYQQSFEEKITFSENKTSGGVATFLVSSLLRSFAKT
jgi:hypothetical protein